MLWFLAGFVLLGTPREPPLERERPAPQPLVSRWATPDSALTASRP